MKKLYIYSVMSVIVMFVGYAQLGAAQLSDFQPNAGTNVMYATNKPANEFQPAGKVPATRAFPQKLSQGGAQGEQEVLPETEGQEVPGHYQSTTSTGF